MRNGTSPVISFVAHRRAEAAVVWLLRKSSIPATPDLHGLAEPARSLGSLMGLAIQRDDALIGNSAKSLTATRAALCLRASTGRQAEHDLSIPDQKAQTRTDPDREPTGSLARQWPLWLRAKDSSSILEHSALATMRLRH